MSAPPINIAMYVLYPLSASHNFANLRLTSDGKMLASQTGTQQFTFTRIYDGYTKTYALCDGNGYLLNTKNAGSNMLFPYQNGGSNISFGLNSWSTVYGWPQQQIDGVNIVGDPDHFYAMLPAASTLNSPWFSSGFYNLNMTPWFEWVNGVIVSGRNYAFNSVAISGNDGQQKGYAYGNSGGTGITSYDGDWINAGVDTTGDAQQGVYGNYPSGAATKAFQVPYISSSYRLRTLTDFGYTFGGFNASYNLNYYTLKSGIGFAMGNYYDKRSDGTIPQGLANDFQYWLRMGNDSAYGGPLQLLPLNFPTIPSASPGALRITKTLQGYYGAVWHPLSGQSFPTQLNGAVDSLYSGSWAALYIFGTANGGHEAQGIYYRLKPPKAPGFLNGSNYSFLSFASDPVIAWIDPNGFVMGVYLGSDGSYWIAAAGYYSVIKSSLGNWARFVSTRDV